MPTTVHGLPTGVHLPANLTHELATDLIAALAKAFGLTTVTIGPATVAARLNTSGQRYELTATEWQRLRQTRAWQALPERVTATAVDDAARFIDAAIRQAGLQCDACHAHLTAPPAETFGYCARCMITLGPAAIQNRPCAMSVKGNPHDFADNPTCQHCGLPAPTTNSGGQAGRDSNVLTLHRNDRTTATPRRAAR